MENKLDSITIKKILITIIVLIIVISISIILTRGEERPHLVIPSPTQKTTQPPPQEKKYYQENGKALTEENIKKQREEFYKKNPLIKYLPYYGEHFEIDYFTKDEKKYSYRITLYVVLNNPSQFEQYKEEYLKYKIEAIEWIKSKGIDYTKLDIEWVPEDPKNINFNQKTEIYPEEKFCKTCQ